MSGTNSFKTYFASASVTKGFYNTDTRWTRATSRWRRSSGCFSRSTRRSQEQTRLDPFTQLKML